MESLPINGDSANGFAKLPHSVNDALCKQPPAAVVIYVRLMRYADKDGKAFPSLTTLADECEMNERTVRRAIAQLRSAGLLSKARKDRGSGKFSRNEYRLTTGHQSPLVDSDHRTPVSTGSGSPPDTGVRHQRTFASITTGHQCPTNKNHKNKNHKNKKESGTGTRPAKRAKRPKFSEADLATAYWMHGLLVANVHPKFRQPNFETWANDIRLIRERDGFTDTEIRAAFSFANSDEFWRHNIQCPNKLREKFSRMLGLMKGRPNGHTNHQPYANYDPNAVGGDI